MPGHGDRVGVPSRREPIVDAPSDDALMAHRPRLLVVDDKPNFLALFRRIAGDELEIFTARDSAEALALLGRERVDVIVSDVKMPGLSGLELLGLVKTRYPDVEVILMTAFGAVPDAVSAIKAGAFHYLTKPFDPDAALALIREAIARRRPRRDIVAGRDRDSRLIASSPAMQSVLDLVAHTGPMNVVALITGETGTGKELVARELHARSARQARPFAAIDCGALAEAAIDAELFGVVGEGRGDVAAQDGLFQLAAGGTLFLDEIQELTVAVQAKVLRALHDHVVRRVGAGEDEAVDVRILAASSADLPELVAAGRFREDLFYLLNVVTIRLPPLRERREDIAALAEDVLARTPSRQGAPLTFSAEARALLESYDWPGNLRQLENAIARAAAGTRGEEILPDALPAELRRATDATPPVDLSALAYREVLAHSRDVSSKEYFIALLKAVGGNVTQAAERAGVHRESLHRLLKRYGLRAEDYRPR